MLKFNQSIINFLFMKKILLFFILFLISFLNFFSVNAFTCRDWDTACQQRQAEDKAFDEELRLADSKVDSKADTEFWAPWAYDAAVAKEAASPSSEKYTWTDFSAWKSNTTDSTSSSYYNNNLKENSLTKDSFSSLEKAGYVNADWSLTEAWKLASWQTDWKCWTECAKSLNSKASAAWKSASSWWPDDLTSTDFIINVDSISPWINSKWSNTTERVNWILWTLIQNMMIWLWILSVLIMTIGSGYIIFHNWQDELLSKGKSIFMSWVYAMIIALTSYYLISIVRYMLYS